MSYITSRIRCDNCRKEMNVAFGIIGNTQIAAWPEECPDCKGRAFTKIADGWQCDPAPSVTGGH